jgi:predicted esterase
VATAKTIAATTHGRYLVEGAGAEGRGLLVGFHGYAESADAQLERMRAIPGSSAWTLVSIQGLHRFYSRRSEDVVGSWMTSQDRELAISDNVRYVSEIVDRVANETRPAAPIVFAGFSQGVAMAFRAACASPRVVSGIVSVGGDVPPELGGVALGRLTRALLARGEHDDWYTRSKWTADGARLRDAGVDVRLFEFAAGHAWNTAVSAAVGTFLECLA